MSYRVDLSGEAQADIDSLPDRESKLAAVRVALALRDDPYFGKALRNRIRIGDLSSCRGVAFDRPDWKDKPRFRLVYRSGPDDASIEVVQVLAIGLRTQLEVYKRAAERLRRELRRRLRDS